MRPIDDDTRELFDRGLTLVSFDQEDAAEDTFMAVLEVAPTHAPAYIELAKIYQRRRDWKSALASWDQAIVHAGHADQRVRLLAYLNKARIFLLHHDRRAEGLRTVRRLIDEIEDGDAVRLLVRELNAAGRRSAARAVKALLVAA